MKYWLKINYFNIKKKKKKKKLITDIINRYF